MKISDKSKQAFLYYLHSYRSGNFTFDGGQNNWNIKYNRLSPTALEVFHKWDAMGKVTYKDIEGNNILETSQPNVLFAVLKAKGGLNFMIKSWAEDRMKGYLPLILFSQRLVRLQQPHLEEEYFPCITDIETELQLPEWAINAVEQQANKLRK